MVMPGATMRNRLVNRTSRGAYCLFRVCQAMSIAMTMVFPEPVAILSAARGRPLLCASFSGSEPLAPVGVRRVSARHLGQEDGCLRRLALGEDDAVLAGRVGPVLEKLPRDRGDAGVLTVTAPLVDIATDVVDQAVLLATLTGRVEVEALLLGAVSTLLALLADRDRDERLARPPAVLDLTSGALRADGVVAVRLLVGRVENGIVDRCAHAYPLDPIPTWTT